MGAVYRWHDYCELTISSKNYSSWSLRGWLLARLSGIEFDVLRVHPADTSARAELLLLSPSTLVPCLTHEGLRIWDTLAIGEYLHEIAPGAGLLPPERQRARCRSVCGEMHSGFAALRSALPMNLKARFLRFKVLFGRLSIADAMYAPVVTRFRTYGVALDPECAAYADAIMAWPDMAQWATDAQAERLAIDELEVEF